jgi:hypothetical protein
MMDREIEAQQVNEARAAMAEFIGSLRGLCLFVTLTYGRHFPASAMRYKRARTDFFEWLNESEPAGCRLEAIAMLEPHADNSLHLHALVFSRTEVLIDTKHVTNSWRHGDAKAERPRSNARVARYVLKNFGNGPADELIVSRGLKLMRTLDG